MVSKKKKLIKKVDKNIVITKNKKSIKNSLLKLLILKNIALGSLIFLLVVAVLVVFVKYEFLITKYFVSSEPTKEYTSEIFYGLTEDNVQSITIKTVQETFILQKEGNKWFIENNEVLDSNIKQLFTDLYQFDQGTLLSKNPRNHLELGISDLLGSFVTIKSGSREVNFVVGNPSSVLNSFYFRIAGSADVYLSNGDLRNIITQPKSFWISK